VPCLSVPCAQLTADFGAVDLAIADERPEVGGNPVLLNKCSTICERQGRCNVGCLPGARYTLNKQLMAAILGTPALSRPGLQLSPSFERFVGALVEVETITPLQEAGMNSLCTKLPTDGPPYHPDSPRGESAQVYRYD